MADVARGVHDKLVRRHPQEVVKIVELDHACRQQQVNDGCFPTFDAVPKHAFTLTCSVFRRATRLSIHVPGPRKAAADERVADFSNQTIAQHSIRYRSIVLQERPRE